MEADWFTQKTFYYSSEKMIIIFFSPEKYPLFLKILKLIQFKMYS